MFNIILSILMVFLIILIFIRCKDFTYPPFVLSFVFSIDIGLFTLFGLLTGSSYQLNYYAIIFPIGIVVFYLGHIIGSKNQIFPTEPIYEKDNYCVTTFFLLFLIVEYLVFFAYIFQLYNIVSINEVTFSIVKYLTATKHAQYYKMPYIFQLARTISFPFSQVCIYRLISYKNAKKDFMLLVLQNVVSSLYVLFDSSRLIMFFYIIPILFIIIFRFYKSNNAIIKLGVSIFVIMFLTLIFNSVVFKGYGLEFNGLFDLFRRYFNSGIVAFSDWMSHPGERLNGQYTFRFLFAILHKLGLYNKPTHWIETTFPNIPGVGFRVGNVYTFYHGFSQDFGPVYALFVQFLIGIFHGFLYYMGRKTKKTFWIILLSIFYMPLLMQFFMETYASHISFWIQIVICVYLLCQTDIFFVKKGKDYEKI